MSAIWRYRNDYTLTVIASFGGMLSGWDTGMIGGILDFATFQKSFALNKDSKNFRNFQGNIVSVLQAGCFFGSMCSFFVSDRFGRRTALLVAAIIFIFGSVLQVCSGLHTESLTLLYVGRVIGGFGVGIISAVAPSYIGENANKEIRGRCIGTMQLFSDIGIMLSYFVNYGLSICTSLGALQWRIPFALQLLPGLLLFIGLFYQNESPRWLVEKHDVTKARHALSRVRAKAEDESVLMQELEEIVEDFRGREGHSLAQQLRMISSSKPIAYQISMAVIVMFWQQWTGTNSINYYSPQIFGSIGLTSTSAGLFATGIYGVVKVVCTMLSLAFATEQLGRKLSLIIGGAGQAFAMYGIGIQGAVAPRGFGPSSYFAVACVYLFVIFYSLGWGPIPFILSSECSPNHIRSLVLAVALMTQWLFNFVIAKITPIMLADITYGTYLLFGSCCVLMVLYTAVFVPETKKVPLESIHLLYEGQIVRGAMRDSFPSRARSKGLQAHSNISKNGPLNAEDSKSGEPLGQHAKGNNV